MLTAILTDYAFIEDEVVNCSDDYVPAQQNWT
jgi:hypothetical protein